MKVEIYPTDRELCARAADLVVELLGSKPDARVLLPAGGTPVPLYAELVRRTRAGQASLDEAWLYQLDEMIGVGPGDARSFHAFLRRTLLEPLGRCAPGAPPSARDALLCGDAEDAAAEIARHGRAVLAEGVPDLAILGIGRNAHLAFNEPGTRRDEGARVVALAPATVDALRSEFAGAAVPTRGMTLGLAEILAARRVILLATGASKADVLGRAFAGEPGPERPASFLGEHPDAWVLADAAAAAQLEPTRVRGA